MNDKPIESNGDDAASQPTANTVLDVDLRAQMKRQFGAQIADLSEKVSLAELLIQKKDRLLGGLAAQLEDHQRTIAELRQKVDALERTVAETKQGSRAKPEKSRHVN